MALWPPEASSSVGTPPLPGHTTRHHVLDQISIEDELRKSYLEYSLSVIVGARHPGRPATGSSPCTGASSSPCTSSPTAGTGRTRSPRVSSVTSSVSTTPTVIRRSMTPWCAWRRNSPCATRWVDGQGNFGSIDGDAAAAMRYTEVRMSRLTAEFLADIDKETVDFRPNYDNSMQEPSVLPTKVPNLLLNGSSGIAVGMATNIPPHNLGELCDALLHIIDTPECSVDSVISRIPGPDFPTGASIFGGQGPAGRLPHRSRLHQNARHRGDRAAEERPRAGGHPRDSLRAEQVQPGGEDRPADQREEDRRRLGPARRIRPQGHSHRA